MRISDWSSDVCSSDLADQHVVAGPAVQRLPAVAAGDDIVEPVARRLAAAARDREVLDVVRKLVAHPCLHGVGAGGGTFNDAIAGAVDVVGVVAREAGEGRRHAAVTPEGVIHVASFEKGAGKGGGEVMNGDEIGRAHV